LIASTITPSTVKPNRGQHVSRILWLLCFCLVTSSGQAMAQEPKTPPKKTGALKDGEKCEQLPCTCGNVEATQVGQKCSLDENVGPATGTWTNPSVLTNPVFWGTVGALVLVAGVVVARRRRGPVMGGGEGSSEAR
jgi:hypothetical protein